LSIVIAIFALIIVTKNDELKQHDDLKGHLHYYIKRDHP
jgi:hypothetical protein